MSWRIYETDVYVFCCSGRENDADGVIKVILTWLWRIHFILKDIFGAFFAFILIGQRIEMK